MIEGILELVRSCELDFVAQACAFDPERDVFESRRAQHPLLYAIARTLEPDDVLQLDCGFGYDAFAILRGCEKTQLVGLDSSPSEASPGSDGAGSGLDWAREINPSERSEFGGGGIEELRGFAPRIFDLVVLRAKAEGDQSYRELEAAVRRGRWVLFLGYCDPLAKQGFLAANEFLHRNRSDLDEVHWLPGAETPLLLRPNARLANAPLEDDFHALRRSSAELRDVYTEEYFRTDCGGYQSYNRDSGRELGDPRLQSVAMISGFALPGRALDIGCGRGEFSYYLAKNGYEVTALDYSPDAIELARSCFAAGDSASERVEFICGDATRVPLDGPYALAVASDVIEHLMPEENERLYERVAKLLGTGGIFVIHTYPNRWYYEREYTRKRASAAAVGAYLPPQPRSRYEVIVHPNEQDPETLAGQLSRHFEDVLVWVGDPFEPGGSLLEEWTREQWEGAPDIFAVASQQPLDVEALTRHLRMAPLASDADAQISLTIASPPPREHAPGSAFQVEIELENRSSSPLVSAGDNALHLSYRWLNSAGEILVADGERTRLIPPLAAGGRRLYRVAVRAPATSASLTLRVTLVQEGIAWLDRSDGGAYVDIPIRVG